ncbi:polysaccharide deacetylase family protein [Sphingomonas sp. AR_OL41]|uniref:polysaccharide deacetylase family protein n=1 Tax=Sphingomonas sp. AR_OL41 TaxID=3042729 RepID=UPI002480A1D8|nr:polysaccharide deacetylase family protein [Sphingomonas sp. AR_OL41]MDH7972188.1 polysaccharide deacetylase family protein [Sphingomonas sp. AR_OL41]
MALVTALPFCRLVRWLGALLLLLPAAAPAKQGQVALTFDDLPALTILHDQPYVDYLNATILRKLRRHHWHATGFVNAGKIDELVRARQIANLAAWREAGMELGNHTYSHESPNAVGAAAYIADIVRGEPVLRELLARHKQRVFWFRHPYLETGSPAPVKREIDDWLAAQGYRVAPVTIDAEDWEFAEPYDDAIARRDVAAQRHIKASYLAYSATRIAWAQRSARLLFGRDIAHVMLLHATRLNADTLDDIALLLRRAGLRPVSLATALRDPVYREPDHYTGKDGIDWLERWAITRHRDLPDSGDEDPPADIKAAYDRVDNDRP